MGAAAVAFAALAGASPPARLDVQVSGLRSGAGQLIVCVTRDAGHFPDCAGDPAARKLKVPAAQAGAIHVAGLASGAYAIAMIHDENMNDRLDRRAMVPTEGVGFSNNPRLIFGPPGFSKAAFAVNQPVVAEAIRMRYFL